METRKIEETLGQLVLVRMMLPSRGPVGSPKPLPQEVRVDRLSPSGRYVKLYFGDTGQWFELDQVEVLDVLSAITDPDPGTQTSISSGPCG